MYHFLQGRRAGVVEGGHLGRQDDRLELLAELVARVHHSVANVLGGNLPRQRVPNEHELVCAEDDELAVRHEDPRGLGGAHAAEEGVDGVEQGDVVRVALVVVEAEQLPVLRAHAAAGGRQALRGLPLGDVVLHGLCNLLFQQLELTQLQGGNKADFTEGRAVCYEGRDQGVEFKGRGLIPSECPELSTREAPLPPKCNLQRLGKLMPEGPSS